MLLNNYCFILKELRYISISLSTTVFLWLGCQVKEAVNLAENSIKGKKETLALFACLSGVKQIVCLIWATVCLPKLQGEGGDQDPLGFFTDYLGNRRKFRCSPSQTWFTLSSQWQFAHIAFGVCPNFLSSFPDICLGPAGSTAHHGALKQLQIFAQSSPLPWKASLNKLVPSASFKSLCNDFASYILLRACCIFSQEFSLKTSSHKSQQVKDGGDILEDGSTGSMLK